MYFVIASMCACFSLTRRFRVVKRQRGKALAVFSKLDMEKFRKRQTHRYKKNTKILTNQNQPKQSKAKQNKDKDYQKLKQMPWKVAHYVPDRGFWDESKPQLYSGTSSHLSLSCFLLCHSPTLGHPAGPPAHSCSLQMLSRIHSNEQISMKSPTAKSV